MNVNFRFVENFNKFLRLTAIDREITELILDQILFHVFLHKSNDLHMSVLQPYLDISFRAGLRIDQAPNNRFETNLHQALNLLLSSFYLPPVYISSHRLILLAGYRVVYHVKQPSLAQYFWDVPPPFQQVVYFYEGHGKLGPASVDKILCN